MIEFELLPLSDRQKLFSNMDKVVFENLYYYYYRDDAPLNYHADNLVSPQIKCHNEYFVKVKPMAMGLFNLWHSELVSVVAQDDEDINNLKRIGESIMDARDMTELVWYSLLLRDVVMQFRQGMRSTTMITL